MVTGAVVENWVDVANFHSFYDSVDVAEADDVKCDSDSYLVDELILYCCSH